MAPRSTSTPRTRTARPAKIEPDVHGFVYGAEETQEEVETKIFSPREIIGYEGLLYVVNISGMIVSFDDNKGNVFKLGNKPRPELETGKFSKEDYVKVLPPEVASHSGFQKFWRKGSVIVTNDPDIEIIDNRGPSSQENDRIRQAHVNGLIANTEYQTPQPDLIPIPIPANAPKDYVPGVG